MSPLRLLVPVLAIAGILLASNRAGACGALPTPTFSISGVSPTDGSSGIARNTGIIVSAVPSSPPGGPTAFADAELIDVLSGDTLPLTNITWFSLGDAEQTMAWHPVAPLAPNHDFRVEVTPVDPPVARPRVPT